MGKNKSLDKGTIVAWLILSIYMFSIFIPFFFTLLTSLKPMNEITKSPVTYFSYKPALKSY